MTARAASFEVLARVSRHQLLRNDEDVALDLVVPPYEPETEPEGTASVASWRHGDDQGIHFNAKARQRQSEDGGSVASWMRSEIPLQAVSSPVTPSLRRIKSSRRGGLPRRLPNTHFYAS